MRAGDLLSLTQLPTCPLPCPAACFIKQHDHWDSENKHLSASQIIPWSMSIFKKKLAAFLLVGERNGPQFRMGNSFFQWTKIDRYKWTLDISGQLLFSMNKNRYNFSEAYLSLEWTKLVTLLISYTCLKVNKISWIIATYSVQFLMLMWTFSLLYFPFNM